MNENRVEPLETFESLYGIVIARIAPEKITQDLQDSIAVPHRHNCYTLMVITSGEANVTIDLQNLKLVENSMLLIKPGQMHSTRLAGEISGWIMLFDHKMVDYTTRFAIDQSCKI